MVRGIHIDERRLVLRRQLAALIEFWEPRTAALLGEALVCQNAADVLVLDDEPRMASVPELDLGDGFICAKFGVFGRRLGGVGTREWEGWGGYGRWEKG